MSDFNAELYIQDMQELVLQLLKQIHERRFTVKDLQDLDQAITYRTINYWSEKGYLLTPRQEGNREWRKMSYAEYVWILFLNELRVMGVAFEPIVHSLFIDLISKVYPNTEGDHARLSSLSFEKLAIEMNKDLALKNFAWLLVHIIGFRTPLTLRFFTSGEVLRVWGNTNFAGQGEELIEYTKKVVESNFENSISISLDGLVKHYIQKKDLDSIKDLQLLSPKEIEILEYSRSKQLTELTINYADGEPDRVTLVDIFENEQKGKRVEDYLISDYADLAFKINGGNTMHVLRKTKAKLG
jgi:hypothetical protein